MSSNRRDLLGLPRKALAERLEPHVDHSYRANQVFDHLYRRGISEFAAMTDLSLALRGELAEQFSIGRPRIAAVSRADDGTVKYLLELADGVQVEAVDIPDRNRRTFCISSQAGCALGCLFCVTGYWGAGRNLTPGEIVGQVLTLAGGEELGPAPINLVFMGMGEPLLNMDSLEPALEILAEFISWRRITVSTVGIVPGIERLASWPQRPNLALSLHAPDDARRSRLMPINRVYPLSELVAVLQNFPLEKGRRITLEYVMIREFNDRVEDAEELAERFSSLAVKVNLIPLNRDPVLGPRMEPSSQAAIDAFRRRLEGHGLVATVRRRRGDDVSAACGQLRAHDREPRGFSRRLGI